MTAFADFLAPISMEEFFRDYFEKKPLHIRGAPGKFATLLPWSAFNRLLAMNAYWSEKTLLIYRDQQPISPQLYCLDTPLFGEGERRADPQKVQAFYADGATIIANYADSLTPEMNAVSKLLEETLFGFALANIYCSRFNRQGFKSHYDHHEVFALQTEGVKTWRVYEGRLDAPVQHPKFRNRPPGFDEQHKKSVLMEVTMRPGDILYIPRGQYHDAIASSDASLHVTYGVQPLTGLDVIGGVIDRMLDDPLFRADLPTPRYGNTESALPAHLAQLGDRVTAILRDPGVVANVLVAQRNRRLARGGYDFPNAKSAAPANAAKLSVSFSTKTL